MAPFLMGTVSSITMQSLGKIAQRTPAVGAKMWWIRDGLHSSSTIVDEL